MELGYKLDQHLTTGCTGYRAVTTNRCQVSVRYEIWDNDSFLNGDDDKVEIAGFQCQKAHHAQIGESSFTITGSGTYTPSCCSSSLVLTATFTPSNHTSTLDT